MFGEGLPTPPKHRTKGLRSRLVIFGRRRGSVSSPATIAGHDGFAQTGTGAGRWPDGVAMRPNSVYACFFRGKLLYFSL
jgi:hypothetical protein